MSEIVIVASFTAKPGKEANAAAAFQALMEPTHQENGCILYALHQGADDPRRLAFVERWESREALEAHLASSHVQEVLARVDELCSDGGDIVVYEPLPGGEHRKGSIAAHAGG
ncbi:MAG: antibiotic biosynthesis monooxygenase [Solirubrobacterales bacterium]|nr:antibiotic biosynthesis monooxygenase [Solirubrobacterales bacterium]MBV9049285.1 antibiotic biosynthesis monooxygenase [Solirubrobacterales bacterium]